MALDQSTSNVLWAKWTVWGALEPVRHLASSFKMNPPFWQKQDPKLEDCNSVLTTHNPLHTGDPWAEEQPDTVTTWGCHSWAKGLEHMLRPQVHALLTALWERDFIFMYCIMLNYCTNHNNPDGHLTLQTSHFTVTECLFFSHFSSNALMGLTWTVPLGNA